MFGGSIGMAPLLTKTEVYDVDILQKLVTKEGITHKDKSDLQRYRKRRIDGNSVIIPYDFGKQFKTLQIGRILPSPYCGLAVFPKDIRAALAQKYYWDVDIENAQPNLLTVLAKKYSVECPALQEYCDNREAVLEEISQNHEMNRDEAKQICISVLFGGFRGQHRLLPLIYTELKELSYKVCADNAKLFAKCKESPNPYASCLSVYIQNEERLVLQQLDAFFTSKDRSMDVLIYDGGLIRKLAGEIDFPSVLLREAEQTILDKTGYQVRLVVKKLQHTFDFEEREQLLPSNVLVNDEYAAKTFVKLVDERLRKVDGSLWVKTSDGIWSCSPESLRGLISEYSSKLVFKQAGAIKVNIFDYGGNEDKIPKMIKQIPLFAPQGSMPLQLAYSLCDTESESQEPLNIFFELCQIIADHKPELYDYLLNWLAHSLQKPFDLPGVALIITGRKGYGKDTLFDFFGQYVLGCQYFTNYIDNNLFFDHFDTGKVNKIMVKLEEADRQICLKNTSLLKGMITGTKVIVNPKNKQSYQATNFCRYVLTTNKGNPVDFTDGERRFVMMASSGEKKGLIDYWLNVREKLFTEVAGKQVAEFLLQRDISSFVPQKLPYNEYQEAVVDSEISVEDRFVDDWDGEECTVNELYNLYSSFCKRTNYLGTENLRSFGMKLVPLIRDKKVEKRKSHGQVVYHKPGTQPQPFLED